MLQGLLAKPLTLLRLFGLVIYWLRSRCGVGGRVCVQVAAEGGYPKCVSDAQVFSRRCFPAGLPGPHTHLEERTPDALHLLLWPRRLAATERAKARAWSEQYQSWGDQIPGESGREGGGCL